MLQNGLYQSPPSRQQSINNNHSQPQGQHVGSQGHVGSQRPHPQTTPSPQLPPQHNGAAGVGNPAAAAVQPAGHPTNPHMVSINVRLPSMKGKTHQ